MGPPPGILQGVRARRFVTMVAVGDIQRGGGKGEGGRVANDPQTDPDSVELGGGGGRSVRRSRDGIGERAIGIGRQQKNRFDVRRGRAPERQTIGLWAGVRLLVRPDAPWFVAFRGDGGEYAAADEP